MCFEVIWLQDPWQNVKWSQIWLSADSDRYNVYCELCSVKMISWVSSTCNFFVFSLFSWFSSDFPLTFSHLLTVALLLWPIKGKRSSSLHIYQIGWYTFQIRKHPPSYLVVLPWSRSVWLRFQNHGFSPTRLVWLKDRFENQSSA